ncbi:MAG: 4-alpha-glucanotransferase [Candidatus Margulisiibacteriota bacterium]
MNNELLTKPTGHSWKRIGISPAAGIVAPIFALRTKQSAGIGDIEDLRLLIDWCSSTGQKIIQILPVNDIGDYETSPYNALSAMALDPVYISLNKLVKKHKLKDPAIDKAIEDIRKEYDPLPRVDYREVRKAREAVLKLIFAKINKEVKPELQKYIKETESWITDYALFRILKKQYNGKSWKDWPKKVRERNEKQYKELLAEHKDEVLFYQFLQMILAEQFTDIHHYANKKGVFLKGDIPILVSPDSVESWAHPEYFKPGFSAGAPPDVFSAKGQRWGFPVYDWEYLAKDNYKFWIDRLKYAEKFFDLFRIDHVLGFFRLWTIPKNKAALLGFFDPQMAIPRALFTENGFAVNELIDDNVLTPVLGDPNHLAFTWYYWKEPYFQSLSEDQKNLLKHWEKEYLDKQQGFWAINGRKLLSVIIKATKMLPCAEDLGVVPPCVPRVLEEMGIPGLRVLRWTRKWEETGQPFINPQDQDFISVMTTSVHDSDSMLEWWTKASQEERNAFWWQFLGWENEASKDLTPESYFYFLQKIYQSSTIFVIKPLQDILNWSHFFPGDPAQYKINTPGTINKNNWSVRYPFTLEELNLDKGTSEFIIKCIGNCR